PCPLLKRLRPTLDLRQEAGREGCIPATDEEAGPPQRPHLRRRKEGRGGFVAQAARFSQRGAALTQVVPCDRAAASRLRARSPCASRASARGPGRTRRTLIAPSRHCTLGSAR